MHLVIYFCGTGSNGESFLGRDDQYNYVPQDGSVGHLCVHGCDAPEVCNSGLFPDLKKFAQRFTQKLFRKDANKLATTEKTDLKSIGVDVARAAVEGFGNEPIESITLCGYSRGAVTCFEVARQLNQIAPKIPVDIVANQPVPGNFYQGPGTNAASVADCSDLGNLRNVSVILGAYTGAVVSPDVDLYVRLRMPEDIEPYKNSYLLIDENMHYIDSDGNGKIVRYNTANFGAFKIKPHIEGKYSIPAYVFTDHVAPEAEKEHTILAHRGFFSQILPKLPRTAHRDLMIIPRESHHQNRVNAPNGEQHLHMQVAKYLHKKGVVSSNALKEKTEQARATYTESADKAANPFPPISQLQSFFGLKKEEAYRHLDKLHPSAHLRKKMPLGEKETLIAWWEKHDKNASTSSTQLTKDLAELIKNTPRDSVDALKKLFDKTECWLIAKENTSTSRYSQVESLRNHIYHLLVNTHKVPIQDMARANRKTMHETGYFLKHWTEGSNAASWFKTDETRALDLAFEKHAKAPQSKVSDDALMTALNKWRDAKNGSQSKRLDLVIEMSEHLQEAIENCYGNALEPENGMQP